MKKKLALILSLLFLLAMFSGCDTDNGNSSPSISSSANTTAPSESIEPEETSPYNYAVGKYPADEKGLATEKYEYELPLSTTDEIFTYWTTNFNPEYLPEEGFGASELPVEVAKRTGVNIEYVVISYESRAENFAVLLAADDLCDVTCNANNYYSSGSFRDAVEKDGYFVNIYDYREYMPNYIYEVNKDPSDISTINTVYTENDLILNVYELKKDPQLTSGPFARGDWLAKMGKTNTDIVTFDDLHEMLMFFKNDLDVEYPMSIYKTLEVVGCNEWVGYDTFCFVSGINNTYVVDGKVNLANINDNDYELMSMINKWYSDGIIDPNWSSYSGTQDIDGKIKASEIGYIIGGGTSIAAHNDVIPEDAEVGWVPLTKPLRTEGQTLHLGYDLPRVYWGSAAISSNCDNIELVCTWLDYRYSESGAFLYGYGIEGLTYEYDENGELWITDYIVTHPAYWGMIMCTYALNHIVEPGLKIDFSMRMKINEDVPKYLEYWMSTPHDNEYVFPAGIIYTSEQSDLLATYGSDVETYINENYLSFVDGSKPLSEWDSYVNGLNDIGIQKILDIYQEAYDACIAKLAEA